MAKGYRRLEHHRKVRSRNPHAVALGHKGGLKGGPARAAALSKEERVKIARMGGHARSSG